MLRIVTTPPAGRTLTGATYRPMYAELTDRDPSPDTKTSS
jgi:hypothetical protein